MHTDTNNSSLHSAYTLEHATHTNAHTHRHTPFFFYPRKCGDHLPKDVDVCAAINKKASEVEMFMWRGIKEGIGSGLFPTSSFQHRPN